MPKGNRNLELIFSEKLTAEERRWRMRCGREGLGLRNKWWQEGDLGEGVVVECVMHEALSLTVV